MTYSIVARDPASGALGVGVQSHYFDVGMVVPWAEAGVGAVATQSLADAGYGPRGLTLMRDGTAASDALGRLVAADELAVVRQVAMVDAAGDVGVHTGDGCVAEAGQRVGTQVSVQANMMLRPTVWDAMLGAFESTRRRPGGADPRRPRCRRSRGWRRRAAGSRRRSSWSTVNAATRRGTTCCSTCGSTTIRTPSSSCGGSSTARARSSS